MRPTASCLRLGRAILSRRCLAVKDAIVVSSIVIEKQQFPVSLSCRSMITTDMSKSSGPLVEEHVIEKHPIRQKKQQKEKSDALIEKELKMALKNHQELLDNNRDTDTIMTSLAQIRNYYQELQWWDDALATESTLLDYTEREVEQADCFGRMGRYYLKMFKFRQAQRCLQTSLEILQQVYPKQFHGHVGRAYNDLARVILQQGHVTIEETLPHLEQAENHYRYHGMTPAQVTHETEANPEQSGELCKVLKNQALLYRINDRHEVAERKYEEALVLLQDDDKEQQLEIQASIADCLLSQEKYEDALERYQEIVHDMQDETPLLGVLLHNIGVIYSKKDRQDEALREFSRAYDIKRRTLGESHFEVAKSLQGLGAVYAGKGDRGEALSYFNEALLICRVNADPELGDNDPNVQHALRNIALLRGDGIRPNKKDPLGG